jgi:hypothetical protein
MKRHAVRALSLVVLIVLGGSARVSADPIPTREIVSGHFVTNTATGRFSISGDGFDLRGTADVAMLGCEPCETGFNQLAALAEVRDLSGTVDGVTYPHLLVGGSIAIPSSLSVGTSITIPPGATTGTQIRVPFSTFEFDRLAGYKDVFQDPVFDFFVTGSGTATFTLHLDGTIDGRPIYSPSEIDWAFGAAATPEPGSVMLVGTGLAAVFVRRRQRRARLS